MFDPNDLKGLSDLSELHELSSVPPISAGDIDDEKTIPQAAFDDTDLALASDDDVILIDDDERAMLVLFGVLDAA